MKRGEYYKLGGVTMNPCSPQKDFFREARSTVICPGCCAPLSTQCAIDAYVQERRPDRASLNTVMGCGLGVMHRDVLEAIGPDCAGRTHNIGSLFNGSNIRLDDWCTFVGRYRIVVRGTEEPAMRICRNCGRAAYFAMDPHYLCPPPPPGIEIFDAVHGELVVTGEVLERIRPETHRKLHCTKLEVLENPKDGLPVDLGGA